MSSTRITKDYTTSVSITGVEVEFDVRVDYYDEDGLCLPDIDVEVFLSDATISLELEDEVIDALSDWFTKDMANQEEDETLYFTYDEILDKVELVGDIPVIEDSQPVIEKALKQLKSDVENGDLTAIEELLKLTPMSIVKGYLSED